MRHWAQALLGSRLPLASLRPRSTGASVYNTPQKTGLVEEDKNVFFNHIHEAIRTFPAVYFLSVIKEI